MASPLAPVRLDSLGTHWSREATSVVGAGLVTALEAVYAGAPSLLANVTTAKLNTATTVVAIATVVATAAIVGYTCRAVVFFVASLVGRIGRRGKEARLSAYLSDRFSHEDLLRALAGSPVLADPVCLLLRRAHWPYCKFWLRVHRPELGVDNPETDINISYSLVLPALLGGPSAVRALGQAGVMVPTPRAYVYSLLAAAIPAIGLFGRGLWRQQREAEEALENYVIARLLVPPHDAANTAGAAPLPEHSVP